MFRRRGGKDRTEELGGSDETRKDKDKDIDVDSMVEFPPLQSRKHEGPCTRCQHRTASMPATLASGQTALPSPSPIAEPSTRSPPHDESDQSKLNLHSPPSSGTESFETARSHISTVSHGHQLFDMAPTRSSSAPLSNRITVKLPNGESHSTIQYLTPEGYHKGHKPFHSDGASPNMSFSSNDPRVTSHERVTNPSSSGSAKKSLNVESPSFTPTQLGGKKSNFSTNATPFTPRGASASLQQDTGASLYKSAPFPDFAPQNYDLNTATATNGSADSGSLSYDPFTMSAVNQALPSAQYNPYAEDHNALAGAGAPYYAAQNSYAAPSQPLQYHLYYPVTSGRENLQPYQRQVFDLFLPDSIREDLQKKSEAARQVLPSQPGVQLPTLQHYHSLVPLDTKLRGVANILALPSWVFKATSRKNGNIFCLRRIEGFRLTNEEAIKAVNSWKKIIHPNIVTTIEAFTTRDFNDSSLVFVHSYHPLSKTLSEHHFPSNRFGRPQPVAEKILWSYLVQLASAVKAIHKAKLAARCIDLSKVILTDKNRVRLSACSVLDVLHFEIPRRLEELQQEDFFHLGRLILSIATNTPIRNLGDLRLPLEQLSRTYSPELKERISWLLSPPQNIPDKTAEHLVFDLAQHADDVLVASFNAQDETVSHLGRELENGRLVRLMSKLGSINERPEFDNDPNWAENSERYTLKLFRDYVFHQVDAQGNPVIDLGHIISCLNKLDAGIDERIYLTSRDHQSTFVVSYKELKKQAQSAFNDLFKASNKQQASRGY